VRNIPRLVSGELHQITVTAVVHAPMATEITNKATIYTASTTGDVREETNDTIRFENNEYTAKVMIEPTCAVDGFLYIDANNDNQYNPEASPTADLAFPI
jgi:hypothetical protein